MAMLLFTLLAGAIRTIGTGININSTNYKNKKKAIEEGRDTYIDHNFTLHHVENDQPFVYWTDWDTKDIWEINPYSHTKIRNVTEENKSRIYNENKQKAIIEGRKFFPIEAVGKHHLHDTGINDIKGYRYGRVDSDEVYVKRRIGGFAAPVLYLNNKTKMFDYYDSRSSYYDQEKIQETMSKLNEEQRIMIKTGHNKYGYKCSMFDINRNGALTSEDYDNGD